MSIIDLSIEQLKEELRYEPDTGEFFWNIRKKGRPYNKPIGSWRLHGSNTIRLSGKSYYLDDIAVYYMTGKSHKYIGFKDFNCKNLKWSNIELLDKEEYNRRQRALVSCTNNSVGIRKNYATGQWYVEQLKNRREEKLSPYFDDPKEAMVAWEKIVTEKRLNG